MCRWCSPSLIADRLTAGVASRRQFLAYAASFAALGPAAALQASAAAGPADVIFSGGPIYPMTAPGARAEALAIGGGRILAAGSEAEVLALAGPSTRKVALNGRALFPGFIDPHNHTVLASLLGLLLTNIGYAQYKTKAEALAAMKAAAATAPAGEWLTFGFYDNLLQHGDWSMAELDSISTSHPIFVLYVNGHVGAGNSLAFARAKVTAETGPLPGGGYFGLGSDGRLDGLVYNEPALLRFLDIALPKPTSETLAKAIADYAQEAAAAGLTTLHEPGTVKPQWVEMLAKLSNDLPIRLSASFSTDAVKESKAVAALGPAAKARRIPKSRLSFYGMKFWADGSNQARSAAQTEPYLNSKSRGKAGYTVPEMTGLCQEAKAAGWTILIHCQGDAAVDDALTAIETAYGTNSSLGLNRLEHATMARADQITRMKSLGVEPSFMMDFVYLYGADYRDLLFGPARADFMVPAGAAAKAGIGYSLHTDNPAAGMPLNPLRLVQTAITRRCMTDGSIIGPDLALTLDEALSAITLNAARQLGLEDDLGSLTPGKEADLTILETDPYKTSADDLMSIKVSETWLAGEKAFG